MLRRSRRAWLLGAALLLAVPQWPAPAAADHDRPGGAGQPAVEAVAGAVTLYEHYNPWICTDPEVPEGAPIDPICLWDSAEAVFSQGDVYPTSCMREIPPGVVIENVAINEMIGEQVNGDCGHSASMSGNDQWAFGGNNHPGHVNVVRGTEERWRCTLAGWDPTVQYHPDGHPVSGQGDWCGVWVPTTPTVNISGATVVEGESAVLTITSSVGGGDGTVQFGTQDGTAIAGSDYGQQSGTHSFSGPGTRQVTVHTIDDSDDEGNETFTVRLSNASGVDIGTALATVTIIDNDDAPCPAGQTGTPPNCVPIVVSTGCGVPAARLSALTVTAGGSSVLSGFSSTTYSYAVTVDGASAGFTATAADAAAVVRIGSGSASTGSASTGSASTGSASSTQYVAEGGSVDVEVVVTSGGDSCTYAVTVNRPSAGLTDCPAFSGQELVDGVCVDACGSGLIVQFDSDGQVAGCIAVGDCPFEMYGTTAAEVQRLGSFTSGPLWLDGPKAHAAMAAGETATLSRRAVKCDEIWPRDPWSISVGVPHTCIWNERNVGGSDGDCLKFSLSVEAVVPEVEDTANRWSPA